MTANTPKMIGSTRKQLSTLTRAKFGPGMLLQHEDLEQLTDYTRELSRLLFRSFFGCGVVCGLVVDVMPPKCGRLRVTVEPGVALDCNGDPIYVPKVQTIDAGDCDKDIPKCDLWVVLCGTSKSCAPRRSACDSDENDGTDCIPTRERDAFEIRIVKGEPECVCRCPEPEEVIETEEEGEREGEGEAEAEGEGEGEGYDETEADDENGAGENGTSHDCGCVNPADPCYKDHYAGKCCTGCGCECDCGGNCAGSTWCDCVLLAKLAWQKDGERWKAEHRFRRFIRPVLMRDHQIEEDKKRSKARAADNS